jgi:hypothetical protein
MNNATPTGNKSAGSVAPENDGNYFASCEDFSNFNAGKSSIVARHFDSLGNPTMGEVVPNPPNDASGNSIIATVPASTTPRVTWYPLLPRGP